MLPAESTPHTVLQAGKLRQPNYVDLFTTNWPNLSLTGGYILVRNAGLVCRRNQHALKSAGTFENPIVADALIMRLGRFLASP